VADDTIAIDPEQFAALIRGATDDQLREGLATNREQILGEIFRRMPERFDPTHARDLQAVIEWRVTERADGGHDVFQLVIREGKCTTRAGHQEEPQVVFEVGPLDFLKLVSGVDSGPQLFLTGKLKVTGDLFLAASVQSFFVLPAGSTGASTPGT
jgi:putative sterol carrier protein